MARTIETVKLVTTGNCRVQVNDDGTFKVWSYSTIIIQGDNVYTVVNRTWYSNTSTRHLREALKWLRQNGHDYGFSQPTHEVRNVNMGEDLSLWTCLPEAIA